MSAIGVLGEDLTDVDTLKVLMRRLLPSGIGVQGRYPQREDALHSDGMLLRICVNFKAQGVRLWLLCTIWISIQLIVNCGMRENFAKSSAPFACRLG